MLVFLPFTAALVLGQTPPDSFQESTTPFNFYGPDSVISMGNIGKDDICVNFYGLESNRGELYYVCSVLVKPSQLYTITASDFPVTNTIGAPQSFTIKLIASNPTTYYPDGSVRSRDCNPSAPLSTSLVSGMKAFLGRAPGTSGTAFQVKQFNPCFYGSSSGPNSCLGELETLDDLRRFHPG